MNFKRFWALFVARNKEFFRDRAAFGWNFLFPFLIVAGFAVIFGNKDYTQFKIGVFPHEQETMEIGNLDLPENLKNTRHINFIGFKNLQEGLDKLKHHRIDILLMAGSPAHRYWVSDSSPKGYIAEKVFQASLIPNQDKAMAEKRKIKGQEIRYIDWLFPGILAMNMMFSALWGVGYVVVRYRKNGVLKRLKATPLTSFEYLSAQVFTDFSPDVHPYSPLVRKRSCTFFQGCGEPVQPSRNLFPGQSQPYLPGTDSGGKGNQ